MAQEYDLTEGLDPSAMTQLGASELLQMIRQALPNSDRGLIIWSATEPDVAESTNQVRYIWIDTSGDAPYPIKIYNPDTDTWGPFSLGDDSVTTDNIVDGNVTPIKIEPGSTKTFLFTNGSSTVGWLSINAAVDDNTLQVSKLLKSTSNGDLLRTNLAGTSAEWFTLDATQYIADFALALNKITNSGGAAGESIRLQTNIADGWEFYTAFESPLSAKGDLLGFDGTIHARLPVGSNGKALVADSTQTTGLKWDDIASGINSEFNGGTSDFGSGAGAGVYAKVTFGNGDMAITLPTSGKKYLVTATIGFNADNGDLTCKLYDSSAAAEVANSEVQTNSRGASGSEFQLCISKIVTASQASAIIQVYAKFSGNDGEVFYTHSRISYIQLN